MIFSNADVIRRVNADFVPVALKAGLVDNPPDNDEGRLYREIGRSKILPQGICVANSAGKVLAWTASHVGRSHTSLGPITYLPTPGKKETVWERDYVLPPVPAVEDTRELTVEVADAGHGQDQEWSLLGHEVEHGERRRDSERLPEVDDDSAQPRPANSALVLAGGGTDGKDCYTIALPLCMW